MTLLRREPRFGTVREGILVLSDAGLLVRYVWLETSGSFPGVILDEFVVMPDHMHAILRLGDGRRLDEAPTLGAVIQRFKSLTTRLYGEGVRREIYPPYDRRLWQERYHDHIIRDLDDLMLRRAYIAASPRRWQARQDEEAGLASNASVTPDFPRGSGLEHASCPRIAYQEAARISDSERR
jgi:REP element-mobilizing transposase RayT